MRAPLLLLLLLLAACHSYGAKTVPRDRFDYSSAVGRSWKQQMLLNIVKLRYLDAPIFLDVQQILAGYTIEGGGSAGWAQGDTPSGLGGWSFGAAGRFIDRPTITYRPLTGSEFAKNLMTPIPPKAIFYLIQAGYPADLIFPLCVSSINGLRSRTGSITERRPADEGFRRYVALLREVQKLGILGMRVEQANKRDVTVIFFPQQNVTPEGEAMLNEIRELLRLDREATEFKITYSSGPGGGNSIVMLTRSVFTLMFELSTQIDVPPEHHAEGQVIPIEELEGRADHAIRVRTSPSAPDDAFVGVEYEDHWFWISKKDLYSKRTFTFLNLLLSFTDTGEPQLPTLVTVPAG
jgi:hypothetical protein